MVPTAHRASSTPGRFPVPGGATASPPCSTPPPRGPPDRTGLWQPAAMRPRLVSRRLAHLRAPVVDSRRTGFGPSLPSGSNSAGRVSASQVGRPQRCGSPRGDPTKSDQLCAATPAVEGPIPACQHRDDHARREQREDRASWPPRLASTPGTVESGPVVKRGDICSSCRSRITMLASRIMTQLRRTTVSAPQATIRTLEAEAQRRRVSLATLLREAVEEKAQELRTRRRPRVGVARSTDGRSAAEVTAEPVAEEPR